MRKLKLFFAACALLVSAGVQAQSWTGSEVGEGYALLYNVGTGKYFTRGNGWGTQASVGGEGAAMTVELKAVDGKYFIRTTKNPYGLEYLSGGTVYTDQSRDKTSTWTFTEVDATNHVYNIISANNHGGGSGTYLTAEGGSSTIVGPGNDGTIDNAKWKVYLYTDQQAKLQTAMANATADSPVDVTAYIKNANFGAYSDIALELWTVTASNKNLNGGDLTNPCAETYQNGGGKIYQTIAVPNGTYVVKCQGYYNGGSTPSYLYANDETPVALKVFNANDEGTAASMNGASASFSAGLYDGNEIQVIVTGKSLTIGIQGQPNNWTCFDNFRLSYLGPLDLTSYATALATAVSNAEATEGTVPTACYNAIAAVVTEYNKPYESAEEYEVAINAINAAVSTYASSALVEAYATCKALIATGKELVEGYDNLLTLMSGFETQIENLTSVDDVVVGGTTIPGFNTINAKLTTANTLFDKWVILKANADQLVSVSNNNAGANATLGEAITTYDNQIKSVNAIDEENLAKVTGAISGLKSAMTTYIKAAEPTNDECFDLTFLIVNPHFTEGEGGRGKVASGWTLAEGGSVTEHRLLTHNFEAWHAKFDLSQTIKDLPMGTYKVTLQGFARHDDASVTDKTNLYCGIVNQPIKNIKDEYSTTSLISGKPALGDTNGESSYKLGENTVYQPNGMSASYYYFQETNPATKQPFYTNEVKTLVPTAGDLKIGFKCEIDKDWVIWDNFHLYYYGSAIAVELEEEIGTSYSDDINNANVTLTKTIYEGWNSITIPFEANVSDFGGGKLYKYDGEEGTTLKFSVISTGNIEPNVPYLLNATTASTGAFTFKGVTVKAATDLTVAGTNYDFVGIYAEASVAEGDYILGEDAFYRSKGGNKVKAYRAYIQKNTAGGESPARMSISIDGVTTAIDAIDGQAVNNATIYNLSGQKVEKAQKGIYIQNGKKMVIK
jgi:hypothetical protein